ncbi:ABC transporter permease [Larkinella knui]|uniref:FtsX-like permease family protein n=1 Tax=Larkinella knui TaxID=2025310 RepID=A0A3P1CDK7_9BACT|nr:ABC transporter permease [Larkinella knui]RRB11433.1 FtsX-like permease family protein [Larkinella knui]
MFRNYLKVALRSLRRDPVYSIIHVTGLSVALAFGLLTYAFVRHERSFDRFYADADRIYRFESTDLFDFEGKPKQHPLNLPFFPAEEHRSLIFSVVFGIEIKQQMPEFQDVIRMGRLSESVVKYGTNAVYEKAILQTDSNYFTFFSIPLAIGQPQQVLAGLHNAVISERLRQKLFANANPVGKAIQYDGKFYTVSGVMQNPPSNTALSAELVVRLESDDYYTRQLEQRYNTSNVYTLGKLSRNAALPQVTAKLASLGPQLFNELIQDLLKGASPEHKSRLTNNGFLLTIRPLTDTHFSFNERWNRTVSPTNVYLLVSISLLILLVAGLNYIIISLSKLAGRLQEVGVRKVVGAAPQQLAVQLWLETVVVVGLASVISLLLAFILLPTFNQLTDRALAVFDVLQTGNLLGLLGMVLVVSLVAGIYPALLFARLQPNLFLGQNRTYKINPLVIQGMMGTQFVLSLVLVTAAITMHKQLNFVQEKELGLTKELVLKVKNLQKFEDGSGPKIYERLLRYQATNPDVLLVASSAGGYGEDAFNRNGTKIKGQQYWALQQSIDYNFFTLLGIKVKEGRLFSPDFRSDTAKSVKAVVINETLAKLLGDELILGKPLETLDGRTVIGVVNDHNIEPLTKAIQPAYYKLGLDFQGVFYLKLTPGNLPAKVTRIARDWPQLSDGQPFEYSFLDQDLEARYRDYQRWTTLTQLATGIALLIAALGLFGLAGIQAINRMREVGIRKVMGATVSQLWLLLNRRTLTLVAVAFVLAIPVSTWLMNRWLASFAYRISLNWSIFALAGGLGFLVALAAVSYHAIRTALMNPVKSLRSE